MLFIYENIRKTIFAKKILTESVFLTQLPTKAGISV